MSLDIIGSPLPTDSIRPFSDLLDITETSFVQAGNGLIDSVSDIHSLRSAFGSLQAILGPEADAALKQQVMEVTLRSGALREDFNQISTATGSLRGVMMSIRSEVRALNTVVSLFANISINARIQGNSLLRPRPQINSFIERLGNLSGEADAILRAVNDAMSKALDALLEIEAAQSALSDEMRQQTLPAIENFTSVAHTISNEQASLRDASQAIAEKMQAVASDVSKLVTSLQIGDTLRQRLEQVHAAISLAGPVQSDRTLSLLLAATLAEGALTETTPYIDDALAALDAVASRGDEIARTAISSAFAGSAIRTSASADRSVAAFDSSLATTRVHFATMQASAQKAREQIEIILGHDSALQGIAQNLRLAGINAVIACARLGEEGRALRELAQWLRANTDESDSTMQRLQDALGRSHQAISSIGEDLIARSENDLTAFLAASSELGAAIDRTNEAQRSVYIQFEGVSRSLGVRVASAISAMKLVQSKMQSSWPTIMSLQFLAKIYPAPDASSDSAQDYLAAIRRKYTMASERSLHDRLIASMTSGDVMPDSAEVAPIAEEAPQDASSVDDLDDILF